MHASPKLRHVMPADRCCNCDSRLGLELLPLRFALGGGAAFEAEAWSLVVRAPFCALCTRTARRRPLRFTEKFLLGLIAFVLLVLASARLPPGWAIEDPLLRVGIALLVGFGLPFLVPRMMPRQRGQASFWRPISVSVPRRQAAKRMIETLEFEFASEPYARAYALANPKPIAGGAIRSRHRPG